MEKRKICWARVLKNISYIIFPVILATLLVLIFYLTYPLEKDAIKAKIDYYDTNTFADNYEKQREFCLSLNEQLEIQLQNRLQIPIKVIEYDENSIKKNQSYDILEMKGRVK